MATLQLLSRNPYQFFISNNVRGEHEDPTGASYAVEYDLWKRPVEYFDELGRETILSHDVGAAAPPATAIPKATSSCSLYDDNNNNETSITDVPAWRAPARPTPVPRRPTS